MCSKSEVHATGICTFLCTFCRQKYAIICQYLQKYGFTDWLKNLIKSKDYEENNYDKNTIHLPRQKLGVRLTIR